MMTAAASIELDAPVEQVWQVVTDLERYSDWNPCFSEVRGTLRANDRLDIGLRLPDSAPLARPVSALVLDIHRHRRLRWLLVSPSSRTADQPSGEIEEGVYDVELVPLGESRVRLVQRLTLAPGSHVWSADRTALRQQLDEMNAALRDRVAWSSANLAPAPQIEGTIRVSSHRGRCPHASSQRPGLLAGLAELVRHGPRFAAA
jgi:hypothetical protein